MGKIKFQQPTISIQKFRSLETEEYDDLCRQVYKENRQWFNETTENNLNIKGVLVIGTEPKEFYTDALFPSPYEIRRISKIERKRVYLLQRPNQFLDITLYFQTRNSEEIRELLKRTKEDVKPYLELFEGISYLNTQSGILNNLEDAFAIGQMKLEKTLVEPGHPEKGRHKQGATVATIEYHGYKVPLRITSQSQIEVHKRHGETLEDQHPGTWQRIERLHRFDDPVLDIFDTYKMKKRRNWPELALYKTK